MPPSGALEDSLKDLIAQWGLDGISENAAPSVTTNTASAIDKVQASLNGTVNANGLATQYWFEWGLDDAGNNFPNATAQAATADTNGGLTAQSVSTVLPGLTCGTDYQYRTAAINADNTPGVPTTGAAVYFSTGGCSFPVANFAGAHVAGVGDTLALPLSLDGDGSTDYQYPVTFDYTVTGTGASDVTLSSSDFTVNTTAHTITINSGVGGDLEVLINANSAAPANASVVISLTAAPTANVTLPDPSAHSIVITGNGAQASIPIHVTQADTQGRFSQYIYQDQGNVTLTANIGSGPYDWSGSDSRLLAASVSMSGATFTFDVTDAGITPGSYTVRLEDGNGQQDSITLQVAATAPVLGCDAEDDANNNGICDADEGLGDFDADGLLDYLDPTGDPTVLNKSVSATGDNLTRMITTSSGLSLALGDVAVEAVGDGHATGTRIPDSILSNDPGYSIMSGVYDFQIRGLTDVQRTAKVVIPLERSMPSNAVYRKLDGSVWTDFIETAADEIRSAASVNNECPPPGSTAYAAGLVVFNDCVELTLTDGGPNDADGEANGVIRDPGGVAVSAAADNDTPAPVPTSAPGGAGTMEWWWLALMPALLWYRRRVSIGKQE